MVLERVSCLQAGGGASSASKNWLHSFPTCNLRKNFKSYMFSIVSYVLLHVCYALLCFCYVFVMFWYIFAMLCYVFARFRNVFAMFCYALLCLATLLQYFLQCFCYLLTDHDVDM